jgi:hypothetical protein
MPTPISKKAIAFPNNNEAIAVFPPPGAKPEDIIAALEITGYKSVLLVIGGADNVDERLKGRLTQIFSRGVARAAATMDAVIIDGGTQAGVMAMMGEGVAERGFKSPLIGVAPLGTITYPGSGGGGETPLDPNHSHFVLVEGNAWGNETNVIFKLVNALRNVRTPAVVLLASGGTITRNEALQAVRQNLPLLIIEGSGGTADEIAAAWRARTKLPDDPVLAEIIADGRIELHRLGKLISGAERVLVRALGGDNVLLQSWGHFADYDLNANLQQKQFQRLQLAIIVIGVLGTALALIKQVGHPTDLETGLRNWWLYRPWPWTVRTDQWVGWWLIYYVLLVIPIVLTVLITAANRFKQGNKWLLLRASAEAIKREIYRYRARAGDYKQVPIAPAVTSPLQPGQPASPETTVPSGTEVSTAPQVPPPTPEQVLAQRVEDITRRAMRTEVNVSALKPYDRDKGLPPYMGAVLAADNGFSVLTPNRYVQVRLSDQLNYYRSRAIKHERKLKVIQWAIFLIGGLGTLLAAINQQVWIALTTAIATALATYLSYQQTESTLTKYNQAATDLANVKAWWTALPPEEQAKQTNIDALVDHTEQVLQSELDGWVQQMQNALAELRKGQAQATEKEETPTPVGEAPPAPVEGEPPAAPGAEEEVKTEDSTAGDQILDVGETALTEEPAAEDTTVAETTTTEETSSTESTGIDDATGTS